MRANKIHSFNINTVYIQNLYFCVIMTGVFLNMLLSEEVEFHDTRTSTVSGPVKHYTIDENSNVEHIMIIPPTLNVEWLSRKKVWRCIFNDRVITSLTNLTVNSTLYRNNGILIPNKEFIEISRCRNATIFYIALA